MVSSERMPPPIWIGRGGGRFGSGGVPSPLYRRAPKWVKGGCRRLHRVDLNGAFEGQPVNGEVVTY